jgi:hypothetical protein
MSREYGDFQTPPELVDEILRILGPVGRQWSRVLEPTCGTGNFVAGLLRGNSPPAEIQGFDIQEEHLRTARQLIGRPQGTSVNLQHKDIFRVDFGSEVLWKTAGRLLVVGNPPWVTNAELGLLASNNLPRKNNLHKSRGIAALTGESNFDLGEALWIKLLTELKAERPTMALLCKTIVARNVLKFANGRNMPIETAEIRRINAKKWFSASVDACLFIVRMGSAQAIIKTSVYKDLSATIPEAVWDETPLEHAPISGTDRTERSEFPNLTWRQGLKHDAASVMELIEGPAGKFWNKVGAAVDVEPEYVYPLLKSSDLFNGRHRNPRRHVIVTQRRINEDTDYLKTDAPRLWNYLQENSEAFAKRKSSVFSRRSKFAMFGVGDYSFAKHKVAVAGLYGEPRFRVLTPILEKPVMLDDTCYFAACRSARQATFWADLLNSEPCLISLKPLIFSGSKRPVTKSLLKRIDVMTLLEKSKKK